MVGKRSEKPLGLRTKGNCFEVYVVGGGEIPANMKGLFTSKKEVELALDVYEASKPKNKRYSNRKVVLDGEDIN